MLFSQCRSNADEHTLTQISFLTNYECWNNIGSSTVNRRNSVNLVSTLFCQCWNNVDKHTSAQLSFSTKFQRWNNIGSSTLNRRNSINVVSTLFCQRWNNVDKCASAQHSFSTKYQRWYVCWVVLVYWLLTLNIPHTWFLRFYCWLWTFKCFLVGDYLGYSVIIVLISD